MTKNVSQQDLRAHVYAIVKHARRASISVATASQSVKDTALERIACNLDRWSSDILQANAQDVREARSAVTRGELSATLVDRLVLDEAKLRQMIQSVRAVAALNDPVGRVLERTRLDDGLELSKISVPLGVIAAIFEARPDAVTQIATLAIKSGNAVILKGGAEATRSTRILVACMKDALAATNDIAPDVIGTIEGRDAVDLLLDMEGDIDLIVPRGSNALVRSIQSRTRIPVMGHAEGICHVYVHERAQPAMAVSIVADSKTQYPAACNAAETLLIDASIAEQLLPDIVGELVRRGVEIRGCERTHVILGTLGLGDRLAPETVQAWRTEYGALTISCKIVDGVDAAIEHINTYGSRHTDTIVTDDHDVAEIFLRRVDAAGVFHNASTRFADGFRYGLGAEVGVSTSKLHARGPVGVEGLTTYKYVLRGDGNVVALYTGTHARPFLHERI